MNTTCKTSAWGCDKQFRSVGSSTMLHTRILGLWAAAASVLLPLSTAAAARCTTVAADCSISPGSLPSSSAL